jgi:glycosyltransferase involved in cell wall biosynthesis
VNDGSTDESGDILREYAEKDERVKVIEFEKNQGPGAARNAGIDVAQGKYIGFVDSDDYPESEFYEKLYEKIAVANSDVVKGSYKYLKTGFINYSLNKKIQEDKTNFSYEFCSAIYNTNFIHKYNIRFYNLRDMEDPIFSFKCGIYANKIEIVDNNYIIIHQNEHSTTEKKQSISQIIEKLKGLKILIDIANTNKDISIESYCYVLALWSNITIINILKNNNNIQIKNFIIKEFNNILERIKYIKEFKEVLVNIDSNSTMLVDDNNIKVYFITVVNDFELYKKLIVNNYFVITNPNIECIYFDNTKENKFISKRYNQFINRYDYSREAWFVFCHTDWEILENIVLKIEKLDKNKIYGPVGGRLGEVGEWYSRIPTGFCYEKRRDGTEKKISGNPKSTTYDMTDTLDCQVIIMHSSLIYNYNLRFDEIFEFDLYVEDFCISAKEKYGIETNILRLYCCHWSNAGYTHERTSSFKRMLSYINGKYKTKSYNSTVGIIGNSNIKIINNNITNICKTLRKKVAYKLRNKIMCKMLRNKVSQSLKKH